MRKVRNAVFGCLLACAVQFGWTAGAVPTVSVSASKSTTTIGTNDYATLVFSRAGSTSGDLVVNYALGGSAVKWTDYRRYEGDMPVSVTIPSGAASTTMTIIGEANVTSANPETATFTLSTSSSYIAGSSNSATINILAAGSTMTTNTTDTTTNTTTGSTNITTGSTGSTNMTSTGSFTTSLTAPDGVSLSMPKVGDNSLRILSPTMLELTRITTKALDPAVVDTWSFVDSTGMILSALPTASQFTVTVNGQTIAVTAVGFKRRALYAPLNNYDLRIQNSIYLQLASPIADNQSVSVSNPGSSLWPSTMQFTATADPLRYAPAIHVNQEGYVPAYPKTAMVGYYLGSLGELNLSAGTPFSLVDANTGAQVYQGTMTLRQDVGYNSTPTPYQDVLQADFSSFTTPGQYKLVVPGLGASLPFRIDEGVAMAFARTYELGLFEQRSGFNVQMPFTRFTHAADHMLPALVPTNASGNFAFTWNLANTYSSQINGDNPAQTAPQLNAPSAQYFPFVNTGPIDVSGGHFDAGDYSKYTWDVAQFIHTLVFAVDSLPGVAQLDNLGIPESGDGISDILQEAKWEADFLAKLQDADGGFYYVVYPIDREYENNVLPENGVQQVVWPKNTVSTASAVAALAQIASSPAFKAAYPTVASNYLAKAKLGWTFLQNAIAKYGKTGAYQKLMHFGDDFTDQDDLAWAACEMFLATGDPQYHTTLKSWFPDPTSTATFRWGWWRLFGSYGNAVRDYAFAVRSGRLTQSQIDSSYQAACITTITNAGNDQLTWSQQGAYGSSFPLNTKHVNAAGWYYSPSQAFDLVTAYQFNPSAAYLDAIMKNMNYEGGCNPVNQMFVTGLGWKRQRELVDQYSENDRRMLPKDGIPIGNVEQGFVWVSTYGSELTELTFPNDNATAAPYPFYDRWGDAFNVTTEASSDDTVRNLATAAYLAAQTSLKTQSWTSASATINPPTDVVPVGQPTTLTWNVPGIDLSNAKIIWEGRDQEPAYGPTFTFTPANNGAQWVEAEAQLPDGRRIVASATFNANSPNVVWVDDNVPTGGQTSADGGDSWNWIGASPGAYNGSTSHQSNLGSGLHEHWFSFATSTLDVATNDTLYSYVYLDPANPPTEIMLGWNDGTWEHRAYWGANSISYGQDGTVSRHYMGALPTAGQWVRLEVPASVVGLGANVLNGMDFSAYGGRVTWDYAGKTSQMTNSPVIVNDPVSTNSNSGFKLSLTRGAGNAPLINWPGVAGKTYRVAYKNNLTDAKWTDLTGDIAGTGAAMSWSDTNTAGVSQRFYVVYSTN